MSQNNKSISWIWVILALILFWPLGLVLLFVKINQDRRAAMKGFMVVILICVSLGLMAIGLGGLALFATEGGTGFAIVALLFGGGGIWVFACAIRLNIRRQRYRKYINLVANQGKTSIDEIASIVRVPYDTARNDLSRMIQRRYFRQMQIDDAQRAIIRPEPIRSEPTRQEPKEPEILPVREAPQVAVSTRAATCSSCGAVGSVSAQFGECEYCGSLIE